MSDYAFWAAIRTVKSKIGTWVGYDRLVSSGYEISKTEWASWVGQAQAAIANRSSELVKPLNRIPSGPGDIFPYESKRATGFMQSVEISVRDRQTGIEEIRFYTFRGDTLRSRGRVVADAVARYREAAATNPDDYPEEILAAWYSGTFQMMPTG